MTTAVGEQFIRALLDRVASCESRRNWSALPESFRRDAVSALKRELLPYLRGNANNVIRARCAMAGAVTFAEVRSAIARLESPVPRCDVCNAVGTDENPIGRQIVSGIETYAHADGCR